MATRIGGGFDGTFNVGACEFKWEASGNYGRSKTVGRIFELVQQNVANALDAMIAPDGSITCRTAAVAASIAVANPNRSPLNPFGVGTVGLAVNYFYLDRLEQRVGLGDIDVTRGEVGQPTHSGTANLTYGVGGFTALLQAQYFGTARFDVNDAANARNPAEIGDWWLFNATLGIDVNRQVAMRFIVANVFDRAPQYPAPAPPPIIRGLSGVISASRRRRGSDRAGVRGE